MQITCTHRAREATAKQSAACATISPVGTGYVVVVLTTVCRITLIAAALIAIDFIRIRIHIHIHTHTHTHILIIIMSNGSTRRMIDT